MCDGYSGTGRINAMQSSFFRSLFYEGGNAVGSENDSSFCDLYQDTGTIRPIKCDHSKIGGFLNRVAVMYNLSNNIDRPWMCGIFRYLTNHLQCINHTIAVTTGRYFNDFHLFLK